MYHWGICAIQWHSQNEAEEAMASTEMNLLKFVLAFCINFQLLESSQWVMTSLTGSSRKNYWLCYSCHRLGTTGSGRSVRAQDLWLEFSLQFTQCRQEAANSMPALKSWQHSSMHPQLSHYCRRHGQLSRLCVPNVSCDHFKQSSSSNGNGKITQAIFRLMRQNISILPYSKQNC